MDERAINQTPPFQKKVTKSSYVPSTASFGDDNAVDRIQTICYFYNCKRFHIQEGEKH